MPFEEVPVLYSPLWKNQLPHTVPLAGHPVAGADLPVVEITLYINGGGIWGPLPEHPMVTNPVHTIIKMVVYGIRNPLAKTGNLALTDKESLMSPFNGLAVRLQIGIGIVYHSCPLFKILLKSFS